MKKNLLLLKSDLLKTSGVLKAAFLLLVLVLIGTASRAQVVYSMGEPGNTSAATSGDLIKKMNYDGTNGSTVITGTNAGLIQPLNVALDGNNNRIFVSEGNLSGNVIKVITGSSVTNTITSANSAYIKAIDYDVVGNWVYYITEGGDITQVTANDALYRVHPDGTGTQTVAASVTKNPYRLEVDAANNKVYVVDVSFSGRSIKTVDLANSNAVTSRAFATTLNSVYDVALDKVTGYLYYCAEGGSAATLSATDQVRRQNIDGTNDVQIAASVCNSPFRLGLDAGNNRLYVGDAYYGSGKIVAINLTNNTFSTTLNFATGQNFPQIYDFGVPDRPTVTTASASSVAATSVTLGGTLVYGYGLSTERGIVYSSTNSTPTVTDTKAANSTATTNGAFSASVTGLTPATTYYARAYAVNGAGTTYGSVVSFLTQSNDANLSAFTISSATLSPAFTAGTTSYTASVTNATTSITVTPTRNQGNATLKVNTVSVTSGSASGSLSLALGNNVISTVVTAQDGSTKTYTLTVSRPKAAQTITFNAIPAKTFGNVDFATGATASSGLTISYVSSNTAVATIVSGQIHIVGAGTSTITASQAGDANYLAASDATQTLTVDKSGQTITFGAIAAKTYGNNDFAPGATVASGLNVTYASDNTVVATIVSNQVHIVGQGTANITASQAGNANYNAAANVVQSLIVNKASVTVTAAAKTKVYGADDPAFTYTATGVVGSDAATGALSRVLPNDNKFIGTYAIVQGTLSYGNNYNVTYVGANLTINKRPVTVLPIGKTKVYGDADPFLNQFQFVASSAAPGDATGDQFGRAPGENVGTYLMTFGTKKFYGNINGTFGDVTDNYDVTVQPAYVTITAKPITVTANAQTKTYGDADPALTYTADALANGESFTGALSRTAGEGFGAYAINKNTLALSSNYTLTYVGANLTIDKKVVNVTADAKTKTYGDSEPALTYIADALANGESFTGALTRVTGENFGTYAISQGSLALSSNYTLNFTGANFTINKKTINVTAAAKTKTYGDTDPALTYTADALLNGDSFTGDISRTAGESAGTYAINQGTLALNSNYALNYTGANLTINKRDINVFAFGPEVHYGDPEATIGFNYNGTLVAGDQLTGTLGREPGTAVGNYALTLNALAVTNPGNYNLTFGGGIYKIIPREVVVSGGNTFKIYGDADPAINYSIVSGSLLPGAQITGALGRVAGETAGPYAVTQNTLAINDSNYLLTFQGGYFEVDRAPLTFTIDNKTKTATKPNPPLTYSIAGYKNGDTEANTFTSAINLTTDANINSAAGDYNIYPIGNVFANNYNITTVGGTLTVTAASSINTLASATLNGGGFNEPFDPATEFYSVDVPNGSTSATLIASVTDPLSTMSIGAYPEVAIPIASGTPYTINFSNGYGEQVGVHVKAEDGSIKSYFFNVSPIPSDSKLANLDTDIGIIAPSFNPLVTSYTLDVPAETAFLTITPTTHDRLATARVNGGEGGGTTGAKTVAVREGGNPFSIVVRSADRTSTTFYQLYVKRPIRLASLTLSEGNLFPAFDPNITTYTAKVNAAIPSITVSPKGSSAEFSMQVNGEYVNYGSESSPVTVNPDGSTTIAVTIFATDGETSKTYTINVVKATSNANLAGISLSNGALDPLFDAATLTFDVYLPNTTTAISFTPTLADASASMTVNADPTVSGATISNNNLTVGLHNYYVAVIAGDGVTTKTYTLSIHRAPSDESGLANILLSAGTLSPAFNQVVSSYDVAVDYTVSSVDITAILKDTTASYSARVNSGNSAVRDGKFTAALRPGINSIVITSAAQSGTMSVTTLIITRGLDPNLSALTISSGTLSPGFDASIYAYTAGVTTATANVTLTPTPVDAGSTVTVNGASPATPVSLAGGDNIIPVVVTATDGSTKTYTVTVSKEKSANILLNTFKLSPSSSLKAISNNATRAAYSMSVAASTTEVTFSAVTADPNASMTINGAAATSGVASAPIQLTGASTPITVVVTAENGTTTKLYEISVNKTGSVNANLSKLTPSAGTLSPAFSANTIAYTASVSNATTSITLTPVTGEGSATVKVNGVAVASGAASAPVALLTGGNTIVTQVTSGSGAVKTYTLMVTRAKSDNVTLNTFKLNPASSLVSISNTGSYASYSMSVAASATAVKFSAVTQHEGATMVINGMPATSGVLSADITLTGYSTPITVVVTAENGTTTKTYEIAIIRSGSVNSNLSKLVLSAGTLSPVFSANTVTYAASVSNITASITLTPTVGESTATVKVNGTAVASASASAPVSLAVGDNVISTVVTSGSGKMKTYTITVNRAAPVALAAIKGTTTDQAASLLREEKPKTAVEEVSQILVHQALSPNGDGVNDYLTIDGITAYPDNTVKVMNRNGEVIYQAKSYNNQSNTFDGHASNGKLQQPGTYFYSLEYKEGDQTKYKTGYIVIKY